jgi:GH25 family lysozyme M1 (1,4-beta-N-acetylmuramidase)
MRKIRLLPALLGMVLTATVFLTLPAAAASYSDTSGHWAESVIEKWSAEYGILKGYDDGTFRPDDTITRGAFAVILDRFLQYQSASDPATFSDTAGAWCEESVLRLNAAGVYRGNEGQALISADITRQQAVTMIARAFHLEESDAALPYDDADAVAEVFRGSVSAMAQRGYLTDTADTNLFRPAAAITRAEVVNILGAMVDTLYQSSGVYSKHISGSLMINAAGGATLKDMTVEGDLIVAPGVTSPVTLSNVTVEGSIRNLGDAQIDRSTDYIDYKGKQVSILPGVEATSFTTDNFEWSDFDRRRLNFTSDQYEARFGIDVSTFQGDIDWQAVAGDGVSFAFIRCGGRGTGSEGKLYTDGRFAQNADGASAAGIETGVYFFAQAVTESEAAEEARYVLDLLSGHNITGPVIYDWEMLGSGTRTYGIDPAVATACARTFCSALEEAGYSTGVYFTDYVGYMKYDLSQLDRYNLWFANYSYKYPNFYYQVNYWQYSSKGKVSGISGSVDVDLQFIRK